MIWAVFPQTFLATDQQVEAMGKRFDQLVENTVRQLRELVEKALEGG